MHFRFAPMHIRFAHGYGFDSTLLTTSYHEHEVRVCVGAQRRHIDLRQIRHSAVHSWKESSTVGVP